MKWFLLLAVLTALWMLRRMARAALARQSAARMTPAAPAAPSPMLRCTACGTQVPAQEALRDARGVYCCAEHQRQPARADK